MTIWLETDKFAASHKALSELRPDLIAPLTSVLDQGIEPETIYTFLCDATFDPDFARIIGNAAHYIQLEKEAQHGP